MNEFNLAVGQRIRDLRECHGYTREKLAELANMNDKFLYEIETGRKGLSAKKLFSLACSLGVSMDFLASGEPSNEEYKVVINLLNSFSRSEVKCLEGIIRGILTMIRS